MPTNDQLSVLEKEIEIDLASVARLADLLDAELRQFNSASSAKDRAYVGHLLHGVYTGWESALHRIAVLFENRLDPAEWHAQLIERMTMDVPGIRPAVIDRDTAVHLHKMRSFRHFYRNSYAVELSAQEMLLVAHAFHAVRENVERSLRAFVKRVRGA